ncbi:Lrp/AsnC family transcriptional regulator [Trinickia terrae]|uniref:Lrp/AsnC family transcriptional regulator n=1 Tax=Trinickia terrae TaxID=2571161 RepID=A0A4U1ID00_9BURK|nr:Lrp/AsnC family transcriptional regulator [Trinickia terrae]TKC91506.1 Lrp/AsnC family transcriptional regulator [Trinickia terrae]
MSKRNTDLDEIDLKILRLLQANGRLTNAEIAAEISLSAPACWKRLKRLEEDVVQGYHATLNQKALGLKLFAFVNIMLDNHSEKSMRAFEAGVMAFPNVVACHNISGRYDYLLQIVVHDMEEFHEVAMHKIRVLGNVKEICTSFAIKEIKRSPRLPV